MYTCVDRIVELGDRADRLEPRLEEWARAAEIPRAERGPPRWVFRRKPSWRALLDWDVENLAVQAVVEVVSEQPLAVRASIGVDFENRATSPAQNEAEVREKLGLLAAYLRGVYDI